MRLIIGYNDKKNEILYTDSWGAGDGCAASALPVAEASCSHFDEFAARCLDGGKALSDFSWTTRMMDAVLLGGVAERLPGRRHVWNDATRSFDTAEATAILKSSYRKGWELPGLA